MTMVSSAIPVAVCSSPSLSSISRRTPSAAAMARSPSLPPKEVEEAIPPTLDAALLASPEAANVLRSARLSLLNNLPSIGIAWSLWCGRCGALREGLGGAETPANGAKTPAKRGREDEDDEDEGDELERELERTLAAMAAEAEAATGGKRGCGARKPQRRRKNPRCTVCGTKFTRPRPSPPPYPPARAVARTRRQSALARSVKAEEAEAEAAAQVAKEKAAKVAKEVKRKDGKELSPAGTVEASRLFGKVPTSDPATPTYPHPKAAPPPQPSGGLSTTLPTSPPPAKKRKIKKSGLAKLLAQNAAREAEKSGSGNWGLG